ncbi:unnamed protein product [Mytilus coruscus]|uniref:Uncharacterized protein n=1 Tax=Mytilus coruscus TaxID=42192 RepID=A0A6J7ZVW4_MYTCO|nr:unnamed protein product [Mytilus coruscus]
MNILRTLKPETSLLIDIIAETIQINRNITGIVGESGTEIVCSFTNTSSYPRYIIIEAHRTTESSLKLATLCKDKASQLLSNGTYLEGRVTLTNITESASTAVMAFVNLTCMDEMTYRCYSNYESDNGTTEDVNSIKSTLSIKDIFPSSNPDTLLSVTKTVNFSRAKHMHSKISIYLQATEGNEILTDGSTLNTSLMDQMDLTTTPYNSTSPTIDYRATSTVESTTSVPSIMENDFITLICLGNVGKPPGFLCFLKFKDQKVIRNYIDTDTTENRILKTVPTLV